jgi:hypothetical protein
MDRHEIRIVRAVQRVVAAAKELTAAEKALVRPKKRTKEAGDVQEKRPANPVSGKARELNK